MWAGSPAVFRTISAPPRSRRLGCPRTDRDFLSESYALCPSLKVRIATKACPFITTLPCRLFVVSRRPGVEAGRVSNVFGKFCRHLGNGRQKRIPLVGFNQDGRDQCPCLRLQLTEERLLLALGQVAGDDNDFELGRTRIQG